MCVNLSFAMVLDNRTSPDYQLCVKTMNQARDKEMSKCHGVALSDKVLTGKCVAI